MLRRLIGRIYPPPARAWWWMVPYSVGLASGKFGDFALAHRLPTWLVVLVSMVAGIPLALADKLYERSVRRAMWRTGGKGIDA